MTRWYMHISLLASQVGNKGQASAFHAVCKNFLNLLHSIEICNTVLLHFLATFTKTKIKAL